jgi:hypothetical protein
MMDSGRGGGQRELDRKKGRKWIKGDAKDGGGERKKGNSVGRR